MSLIPERVGKLPQPVGPEEAMLVLKRGPGATVSSFYPLVLLLSSDASLFHETVLHTFERSQLFLSLEVSRLKVLLDYLLLIVTARELTFKSFL